MENDLILDIDNVGPISHAKINIGKINVVGGINSSGKSTASKLLYCFLRANSNNNLLSYEHFYESLRNIERYLPMAKSYLNNEYANKLYTSFRQLRNSVVHGGTEEDLIKNFDDFSKVFNELSIKYFIMFEKDPRFRRLKLNYETMEKYVSDTLKNPEKIYISNLTELIDLEFNIQGKSDFGGISKLYLPKSSFEQKINFAEYEFNQKNSYPIEEIYYLDSFSIYDDDNLGLFNSEHVQSLTKSLYQPYQIKPGFNDSLELILNELLLKINNLINGSITAIRRKENLFVNSEDVSSPMKNTASGIKQIGVVQRLISNHKLTPGSFLIIDEPEVNLHPAWQVKFAEILVLISLELDVTIYINTHSPMFIESLSLFSEFYGLLEETNVYLTEDDENSKFTFKKINPKDMGAVYENLSRPYDDLDDLKSKILFKED